MKLSDKGFTLVEVLLAAAILVFCLCGLLVTYINMFFLTGLLRDFTLTVNAMQLQMERIKSRSFDDLEDFNGDTFDINGIADLDAEGVIYVTDTVYPDLKRVRIVTSFRSHQRIIGEDSDLDGTLDTGEDANDNDRLDSPAEIVSLITR